MVQKAREKEQKSWYKITIIHRCIEAGTRAAYSVIIIDRWGAILKWPEGILYIYAGSSENREITDNHREREVTRLDSPLTITATL